MNNNRHSPKSAKRIIYYIHLLLLIGHGYGYSQQQTHTESNDTLSYHLPNIVVTAIESKAPGSTSLLPASTIGHVQPTSAADLIQLLPGGLTGNSGFNVPQYFTVREVTFANNGNRTSASIAEGMQIVIDGSPLHQNANINSPYTGADTRFLSMNGLERVEVVRGIPSAQYGNLTNGVLMMKTRTGEMPLTLGIRYNPNLKQYTAGKGFSISPAGHTLNLLADYTTQDLFHTGGLRLANGYRWLPGGTPLLLNLSYSARIGGVKLVIDDKDRSQKQRQDHRFSISSEWQPNRRMLQELSLRIDVSASKNIDETYQVTNANIGTTDATVSGETVAHLYATRYIAHKLIHERPVYAEAEVIASTHLPLAHNGQITLKAGANWRSEGNRGRGVQFDAALPPDGSIRPRPYSDIPFLHNGALFAETTVRWQQLTLQAGMRYQAQMASGYDVAGSAEPRINLNYTVLSTPNYQLRLKGGAGLMSYMPTTTQLYPGPTYNDHISFYYNDSKANNSLLLINVHAPGEVRNTSLRPTVNRKMEAGFMLETPAVRLDMTGFFERQTGGFVTIKDFIPYTWRDYDTPHTSGLRPEYHDGQVWINGEPVDSNEKTSFTKISTPLNALQTRKYGIEMTADFGTFQPLLTSLIVDGAWLHIRRTDNSLSAKTSTNEVGGEPYPYIGYYNTGINGIGNERILEQLTSNFRFITRIPRIGLVTTLTLQMIWMTKDQTLYNGGELETITPVYWSTADGIRHPYTEAEQENGDFYYLTNLIHKEAFKQNSYKPYGLINVRISKEFTRYVTLSFFANNLVDMRPPRWQDTSSLYISQNPAPFFGLEMQIKL